MKDALTPVLLLRANALPIPWEGTHREQRIGGAVAEERQVHGVLVAQNLHTESANVHLLFVSAVNFQPPSTMNYSQGGFSTYQ